MRPARGRPAAGPPKRSCVVRLEKVQARQDDVAEDDRKKMTGPLKKRPVVMKKSPGTPTVVRQKRRRGPAEDLSEYMLVTARAKRTPKPNPKYSNEDIVTPRARNKEALEESEVDEDDAYQSSEADIPQEESSEEEFEPSRPMTRGGRLANGEVFKRGPGRPARGRLQGAAPKQVQKRRLDIESDGKDFESIIAQNKRLNIELYDASDSDISIAAPTTRRVVRSTPEPSQRPVQRLGLKSQPQKEQQKRFPERRRVPQSAPQRKRMSSEEDEDDPDDYRGTGVASTVDDFETMPTFTIVNINDIINKKGDVMIEQTNRVNNNVTSSNNSSQASSQPPRTEEPRISPNQASRNRRKSMHTTILSDKIDPDKLKNPPPRSPFPPRKTISPNNPMNHSSTKSLLNNNQTYSPTPRILNSVLCRRTKALQAKQEQLDEMKQQQQQQQQHQTQLQKTIESRTEPPVQSKENHLNNFRSTVTAPSGNTITVPPPTNRKLPSSKVVVQRQGNKIIKKITCFETWYVINIPDIQVPGPKCQLDMPLIRLANTAKQVTMPSSDWNYKVNLQKLNAAQVYKRSEVFTGEVQDANISESEKHNYMPVSVMFRRATNHKLRMPFDRAVIFKNESYYTNIDGKNVRLLGSPHKISSHEDIEVLLQIMDEMTLMNPLVEQVTYVL